MALSSAFMDASITLRDVAVNTCRVRRPRLGVNNSFMESFGKRLRYLRQAARLTQEGLAHACGYGGQSRISNYEKDLRLPSLAEIPTLAKALGVHQAELLSALPPSEEVDENWPPILAYRQAAALGAGQVVDEYAETHKLKFRAESLRRKHLRADKLAIVYGKGDSMHPTIRDGDAILIDTSDQVPKDGKLYVISEGNDLMAKRLVEIDGEWFAMSDNPAYKPRRLDETTGIRVAGRIRWVAGWVD